MHISQTMDEVVTSVPMWDRITVLRNRSWRQLVSSIAPNNALFRMNNSLVGGITTAVFCIGVSKTQQVSHRTLPSMHRLDKRTMSAL